MILNNFVQPGHGPYAVKRTFFVPDVMSRAGHTKRWPSTFEKWNKQLRLDGDEDEIKIAFGSISLKADKRSL